MGGRSGFPPASWTAYSGSKLQQSTDTPAAASPAAAPRGDGSAPVRSNVPAGNQNLAGGQRVPARSPRTPPTQNHTAPEARERVALHARPREGSWLPRGRGTERVVLLPLRAAGVVHCPIKTAAAVALLDNHRRPVGDVVEEVRGKFVGQADAAVGGGIAGKISGVHSNRAVKAHEVGHGSASEGRPGRAFV